MSRKKYDIVSILTVMMIVVFISACRQNVQIEELGDVDRVQHDLVIVDALISSKVVDVSPREIVIEYTNNAKDLDIVWGRGQSYRLERLVADGTWEVVPFGENRGIFTDDEIILFRSDTNTESIAIDLYSHHLQELEAGTYLLTRFVWGLPESEDEGYDLNVLNRSGWFIHETDEAEFIGLYVSTIFKID